MQSFLVRQYNSLYIRTYKFDRLVRCSKMEVIACMSIERIIEGAKDIEVL
jgi:hypothetical protein